MIFVPLLLLNIGEMVYNRLRMDECEHATLQKEKKQFEKRRENREKTAKTTNEGSRHE